MRTVLMVSARRGIRSCRWSTAVLLLACGITAPARAQCSAPQQAKLIASDAAASDNFGGSVALSGDTALIEALTDDNAGGPNAGSVYVFARSGSVWTQQQKLTASDAAANDDFGSSVALSGDTAVIGASNGDAPAAANTGAAYVFVRSGGVWTQQAKLIASDAATDVGDRFGYSAAISGDTALVGSPGFYPGASDGSAYVFVRSGGVWTQQAKLTPLDARGGDEFGYSVALSGDTALVGAINNDNASGFIAGSSYVFVRNGGAWTQQAKLTAADAGAFASFGCSIAIAGDTVIAGACTKSDIGLANAGAAYVFVRSGGTWTQQQKLTASDAAQGDEFGVSVALSGDTAIVGANFGSSAGVTGAGSAYVFARSGGVWTQRPKLTASDAAASDQFGFRVALSGNTALVGAWSDDHAGGTDAGSAYVFPAGCDSDGDGVPDDQDACPDNAPGLRVDSNGRPLNDCNGDCMADGGDIHCITAEMLGP